MRLHSRDPDPHKNHAKVTFNAAYIVKQAPKLLNAYLDYAMFKRLTCVSIYSDECVKRFIVNPIQI